MLKLYSRGIFYHLLPIKEFDDLASFALLKFLKPLSSLETICNALKYVREEENLRIFQIIWRYRLLQVNLS